MSHVWRENTYPAENQMKNLLLYNDEKCNDLDICCGLKTKVYCVPGHVSSGVVIGATTLPVDVQITCFTRLHPAVFGLDREKLYGKEFAPRVITFSKYLRCQK